MIQKGRRPIHSVPHAMSECQLGALHMERLRKWKYLRFIELFISLTEPSGTRMCEAPTAREGAQPMSVVSATYFLSRAQLSVHLVSPEIDRPVFDIFMKVGRINCCRSIPIGGYA
jgi:hypothetical protein